MPFTEDDVIRIEGKFRELQHTLDLGDARRLFKEASKLKSIPEHLIDELDSFVDILSRPMRFEKLINSGQSIESKIEGANRLLQILSPKLVWSREIRLFTEEIIRKIQSTVEDLRTRNKGGRSCSGDNALLYSIQDAKSKRTDKSHNQDRKTRLLPETKHPAVRSVGFRSPVGDSNAPNYPKFYGQCARLQEGGYYPPERRIVSSRKKDISDDYK